MSRDGQRSSLPADVCEIATEPWQKDTDTHIIETIKCEQMYNNCEDLLPAASFYANISSNKKMKMHFQI